MTGSAGDCAATKHSELADDKENRGHSVGIACVNIGTCSVSVFNGNGVTVEIDDDISVFADDKSVILHGLALCDHRLLIIIGGIFHVISILLIVRGIENLEEVIKAGHFMLKKERGIAPCFQSTVELSVLLLS